MRHNMDKYYDICIIGEGPCGLSCAIHVALEGLKTAIVEVGNAYSKRWCSADNGGECVNCKTCHVISGFGGCVHFGDSAKLSYYPSGKKLYDKLGSDYQRILEKACNIWDVNYELDFIRQKIDGSEFGIEIKDYPVCVLNSKKIEKRLQWMHQQLLKHGVDVYNCMMIDYQYQGNGFCVELGADYHIICKSLVLAMGRAGRNWLKKNIHVKELQHEAPISTYGLRFEMPKSYLIDIGMMHPDFKARTVYNNIKYKSFCYCGGQNGGRLKFINYGDYILLDGHVLTETDIDVGYGNFALLRQTNSPMNEGRSNSQSINDILDRYKCISGGRPIYQDYYSFKNNIDSRPSNGVSAACVKPGAVYKLFNTFADKDEFCIVAERILSFIANKNNISLEDILLRVTVIGLELEGLWDRIETDKKFMTRTSGLYVGGDCGGETQGILQATMMGIKIAEAITETS